MSLTSVALRPGQGFSLGPGHAPRLCVLPAAQASGQPPGEEAGPAAPLGCWRFQGKGREGCGQSGEAGQGAALDEGWVDDRGAQLWARPASRVLLPGDKMKVSGRGAAGRQNGEGAEMVQGQGRERKRNRERQRQRAAGPELVSSLRVGSLPQARPRGRAGPWKWGFPTYHPYSLPTQKAPTFPAPGLTADRDLSVSCLCRVCAHVRVCPRVSMVCTCVSRSLSLGLATRQLERQPGHHDRPLPEPGPMRPMRGPWGAPGG